MLWPAANPRCAWMARAAGVFLAAGALWAAVAGCAAEPLAPAFADWIAKTAQPPAGRALIFVYRPSIAGIGIHPALLVNGTPRGFLDARTFYLLEVPPGTVTLTVDEVSPNSMDETVAAGETKYVRVTLAPGRTFRGYPVAASAEEAKPSLKTCRLVRFIRL